MIGGYKGKSLKDQNKWPLWITIAVNWLVFYSIIQSGALSVSGVKALLTDVSNLLPAGIALIVTSVANGLLSANTKARLVFLRWRHPLPGSRAFSKLAAQDPRIDLVRLKKLLGNKMPNGPEEENRIWFRFYKELEHDKAVLDVHRDFLFTRDYTALSTLFLVIFGGAALYLDRAKVSGTYAALLLVQLLIVRQAASTYGNRFVCTVLARKSAKPAAKSSTKA